MTETAESTHFLEARSASLRFPGAASFALDSVSLAASRGELVCLLGPNGSGKSSLLRLLAGILEPSSGEVKLLGKRSASLPRDAAARLAAFLPQGATVAFDYSSLEVVLMGRHPFGRGAFLEKAEDVESSVRALDLAGASELRDRPFATLSGGERQRVLIARTIAQGTPALLLDEPTSAQDLSRALRVFELSAKLAHDERKAVLLATHDVNAAARHADRVVVLDSGKVASSGKPGEVLTESLLRAVFHVEPLVGKTPSGAPWFVALSPGEGKP